MKHHYDPFLYLSIFNCTPFDIANTRRCRLLAQETFLHRAYDGRIQAVTHSFRVPYHWVL